MNEQPTHPRRKIDAIGIGTAVLLTGAAYLIGVEPILAREAELSERKAEVAAKRESAEAAAAAVSATRQKLATAERLVEENPLRLQPLYRLNTRLAEVAVAASRHGLQVDQIEPGRAAPGSQYATVPIRVTGRATYGGSTRFLNELRETMPDIAVATIELAGDPRSGNAVAGTLARFTITLLWHAAPDAEGARS